MADFRESPSQTAGPYVHIGFMPEDQDINGLRLESFAAPPSEGQFCVRGGLFDGSGEPVEDAVIEIFVGGTFFRVDSRGGYEFFVDRPENGFLTIMIFARGINTALHTRMYFPGTELDPNIPVDRAATLVAQPGEGSELQFDIRLQGEDETVFFDV